jgi:hypothetical protein
MFRMSAFAKSQSEKCDPSSEAVRRSDPTKRQPRIHLGRRPPSCTVVNSKPEKSSLRKLARLFRSLRAALSDSGRGNFEVMPRAYRLLQTSIRRQGKLEGAFPASADPE